MAEHADNESGKDAARPRPAAGLTVFGRQGSPTLTVALPFSHVDVKADDATPLVAELSTLIGRLAHALESAGLPEAATAELTAIAIAADTLAAGRRPAGLETDH